MRSGENSGRTLPHRNVVKLLERLGSWNGDRLDLLLPPGDPALVTAILLQAGSGGSILAAARAF